MLNPAPTLPICVLSFEMSSYNICIIFKREIAVLYETASRAGAQDFGRGMPDPLLQRTSQMGLIEVADFVNGIENWDALCQKCRRPLRPFDLKNLGLGQASGA